jgi:hydrogenase maturation protein HypF
VSVQALAERIRVRGIVQGVGFRPTVWRLAQRYHLRGWVANDEQGVDIRISGAPDSVDAFVRALTAEAPPLARVDGIERTPSDPLDVDDFRIFTSNPGLARTGVAPDAATCNACVQEVFDPLARRYRYPFTNCTHCGPRLSIVTAIPYDRATTTMRGFALCAACENEYAHAGDRRFHAQPIACSTCGPQVVLERADGVPVALDMLSHQDGIDAARALLQRGEIVAVKGIGGYQLACDATDERAVKELRARKHRESKPLALMARDLDVIARYCVLDPTAARLLRSAEAPIVVMEASGAARVAAAVAPGLRTLGFMLPNTPLHHLLLQRVERPIVLTSANLSDEPQCIDDDDARERLRGITTYFLSHNRPIARRVDDSVVRVMAGAPRVLRRARGYAPAPLAMPPGFEHAPNVLAFGGELKNAFCLLRAGEAIVSHHIGDLAEARTHADYRRALDDYQRLFSCTPEVHAIDAHPDYLASKLGLERARGDALPCHEVQHHHAHIASCLADNGMPLESGPVIGVALDGLGFGADGTLWGGEFLVANYREFQRVATFKPVALLGGERAMREPWRNTYAHLSAAIGWPHLATQFAALDVYRFLAAKPLAVLDGMLRERINSPLASSCGRLFDAAAAATGICRERVGYEGEAAAHFEALADPATLAELGEQSAYPFMISTLEGSDLPYVDPLSMWRTLLEDLRDGTPVPVISARFHKGLAGVIVQLAVRAAREHGHSGFGRQRIDTVALSGGVFQNKVLLELTIRQLEVEGFRVLIQRQVPPNDGGLALGQAAVVAARLLARA